MTGELDTFLAELELELIASPQVVERVRAAVAALLDLHAEGLANIMILLAARGEAGREIRRELVRDRAVKSLLLLHGLHPVGLLVRAQAALVELEPSLREQGVTSCLLAAEAGRVAVRLDPVPGVLQRGGARQLVEYALAKAAPDAEVEVSLGDGARA